MEIKLILYMMNYNKIRSSSAIYKSLAVDRKFIYIIPCIYGACRSSIEFMAPVASCSRHPHCMDGDDGL